MNSLSPKLPPADGGETPEDGHPADAASEAAARPPRETPRDRGARIMRAALAADRFAFSRPGAFVMVALDGGSAARMDGSAHRDVDGRRRMLAAVYRDAMAREPSAEELRAMRDVLGDSAEAWTRSDQLLREAELSAAAEAAAANAADSAEAGLVAVGADGDQGEGTEFAREGGDGRPSQADLVVGLCEEEAVEFWESTGGDAYATVRESCRIENWQTTSRDFKRWVMRKFYERHRKVPRREAMNDALGVLQGKAMNGEKHDVHVRLAGHDGRVYIDLGDPQRHVVVISAAGWEVMQEVPVRFRRPPGMLPLPRPVPGGSIEGLRALVNVPDDDAWVLLVGFLLGCLRPDGPYIVLVLLGEQGTAKSTLARIIVMLIDPKDAPLRRPPKEERDLVIAARNGHLIVWNNVSNLSETMSDAISSLSTEGGFATRTLFENDEETRFKDRRPSILNGIDDFVTRGDLADRSSKLLLQKIKKGGRKLEAEILRKVEALRPQILGVLCDAVATALRNEPGLVVDDLPRMADAARWITAGESAFGWERGRYLKAYRRMAGESIAAVVEASPVAQAIRSHAKSEPWRGSAGRLLKELAQSNPELSKRKEWPGSPQAMSSVLRRFAPSLRDLGLTLEQDKEEDKVLRTKLWTLSLAAEPPVPAPPAPPAACVPQAPEDLGVAPPDAWRCPACGNWANDAHECPEVQP